jgi:Ca2+ transporting ATPase
VEPLVILVILVCNATVGVIQETNAEKAIEKLKEMEAVKATVMRAGKIQTVDPAELVPGDIVHVAVGDKVPADLRLINLLSASLTADESSLTGEPVSIQKHTSAITNNKEALVDQDKTNLLFRSTLITRGKGVGVVVAIGKDTSIGKIQSSLQKSEDEEETKTPLQEKLDEFGELLSKIIGVICIVVWLINFNHFFDEEHGGVLQGAIYYFKIAVALAVAAIPEGLPAVVTSCLALGTTKMAKKNAIVRSLPSVETLGCTTVICSDKTGTLTTNKMTVQKVLLVENGKSQEYEVTGSGWELKGEVILNDKPVKINNTWNELAKICTLCNDASLESKSGVISKVGESTEAALKVLAEKIGRADGAQSNSIHYTHDSYNNDFNRVFTLEFHRERKSMSVVVENKKTKERRLLAKGAPESILGRCSNVLQADGTTVNLSESLRKEIMDSLENRIAVKGLRCIALAYLEKPKFSDAEYATMEKYEEIENNMTFVGLAAMMDPPREEVKKALQVCKDAGIRVIVITGDNKITATSICRMIGVFGPTEDITGRAFTGAEFFSKSQEEQERLIRTVNLFARVEPLHKQKLVDLLQKQREIVAMTGDGVNDAPALKKADIGVAMGSGTAVAKEASDMVLQDDNFSTIVMAVEEGRAIYANTKGFIRYLISSNIGEVVCIFLTAAVGMPEALIPVQLLWVNLVTDGLPATALGFNKPDADIMRLPPRGRSDPIITPWLLVRYILIGTYVGVATVGGFIHWYLSSSIGPGITFEQLTSFHACSADNALFKGIDCSIFENPLPSTISLSILVTIEMFNTFNALSENQSLFSVYPWANPWVLVAVLVSFLLHFMILYVPFFHSVFSVTSIGWVEWRVVLMWSAPILVLDELLKLFARSVFSEKRGESKSSSRKVKTN